MARGNHALVSDEQLIFKRGRRRAQLGLSWADPNPDPDLMRQAATLAQALDLGGAADDANQRRALQLLTTHIRFLAPDPGACPPALQTVFDGLLRRMTDNSRRLNRVPRCVRWGLHLEASETREVVAEPGGLTMHLRHEYSSSTLCGVQVGPDWDQQKQVGTFGWFRANKDNFIGLMDLCPTCTTKGDEEGMEAASVSYDDPVYSEAVRERCKRACRQELLMRILDGPEFGGELLDELEYQVERALTNTIAPVVADEILKRGVGWIRDEWFVKEPWGVLLRRAEARRYDLIGRYRWLHRDDIRLLPKITWPLKQLLVETLTDVLEREIPLDSVELAKEERVLTHTLLPQLVYSAWPEVARAILDPTIKNQQMPLPSAAVFLKLQELDKVAEQPLWPG